MQNGALKGQADMMADKHSTIVIENFGEDYWWEGVHVKGRGCSDSMYKGVFILNSRCQLIIPLRSGYFT